MKYELSVPLQDLVKALKSLVKHRRKLAKEVVISLSDGILAIDLPEGGIEIPASGDWPSAVRVRGEFLLRIARVPPTENPLQFTVEGERLWIGRTSFPCKVDDTKDGSASGSTGGPTLAAQPHLLNPSEGVGPAATMPPPVKHLLQQREGLVAQAAEILSPLGVSQQELKALVDKCLRRQRPGSNES